MLLNTLSNTVRFENSDAYVIVDALPVDNGYVVEAIDYETELAADGEDMVGEPAIPEGTYIEEGQMYVTEEAPAVVQEVLLASGIAEEEMSRDGDDDLPPLDNDDNSLEYSLDNFNVIKNDNDADAGRSSDAGSSSSAGSNANAGDNTGNSSDNATLEYLQQYNAKTKQFNNFDAVGNYTTEILSYVNPTAGKVASYVNDTYSIFKGLYLGNAGAVLGGTMGILRKFGLFKQDPGVTNEQLLDELKNVRVDIQNVMSEVQNVGLEVVDLRCLTAVMNESVKIIEQELYTQGVEAFDNALIALEADAEIVQRMFAQGAIVADQQGIFVPTENCTAEEEFDFNTELVEVIIAEEKKGGKAAQPFRDFENYVEDLRKNFILVAGAVAKPEATNPIIKYDKYWNTYFNFETQGYYLRQAYRSNIAYQLTRAISLLEIYYNIFDPRTASTQYTHYDNYVKAMDALEKMSAGQSPEDVDRSAQDQGNGQYWGNKMFRVYCPTFNCDFTALDLHWKLVGNKVPDEQIEEFIKKLHGRTLEEELRLAGIWGNGVVGERRSIWFDGTISLYEGDSLLWDGKMYDGSWDSYASRSYYYFSGHGIGLNGIEKDGKYYSDIIDSNGILHKEVLTYQEDRYGYLTSAFEMPPEMKFTLRVPYIRFTMEPHVG